MRVAPYRVVYADGRERVKRLSSEHAQRLEERRDVRSVTRLDRPLEPAEDVIPEPAKVFEETSTEDVSPEAGEPSAEEPVEAEQPQEDLPAEAAEDPPAEQPQEDPPVEPNPEPEPEPEPEPAPKRRRRSLRDKQRKDPSDK